jgi:hypothetical protein
MNDPHHFLISVMQIVLCCASLFLMRDGPTEVGAATR